MMRFTRGFVALVALATLGACSAESAVAPVSQHVGPGCTLVSHLPNGGTLKWYYDGYVKPCPVPLGETTWTYTTGGGTTSTYEVIWD
jgi:hypothetical protein